MVIVKHCFIAALLSFVLVAQGARESAGLAPPRADLPKELEFQKVLHKYMGSLTEKDFDHGVTAKLGGKPGSADPDVLYRNYIYTLSPQPLVGSKRGTPAINSPPSNFLLSKIETDKGVMRPAGQAEATISLVQWNFPGNPYYDNRGLKMRCFVCSTVNLLMIDDFLDKNPTLVRTDRFSFWLITIGAAYPAFKDQLPIEVQKAFAAGVRKLADRLLAVEPKGEESSLDMIAPVGLSYAARVVNDPPFSKRVEDYARKMYADPRFFHPAGYWVERGGVDVNYAGTQNYFAIWAALMNDWPFANEAIDKLYRLRAHLMLPEPSGKFSGPSAFNNRSGGGASGDQWDYANRDRGAAMITDEVAFQINVPTDDLLADGGESRATEFNRQIHENPLIGGGKKGFRPSAEIFNGPWVYWAIPNWNFPATVNPAFEFYKKGSLAHLKVLADKNSPMLKSPYLRGENFVRNFSDAFIATRQPTFAAIVHSGPVATQDSSDGRFQFGAPLGYGGGQLSAFWTPATGSVILARRAGQYWQKSFDDIKAFQNIPIHAVSGTTSDGTVFTSSRCVKPASLKVETKNAEASVDYAGTLVALKTVKDPDEPDKAKARDIVYDGSLAGTIRYSRSFRTDDKGVTVQTTLVGDGKDQIAELYETIPVFIVDPSHLTPSEKGKDHPQTKIEFQVGNTWSDATDSYVNNVKAMRIHRHAGEVTVTFEKPCRAKLAPKEFTDTYVSRAKCRNVMIDLLENGDKPGALKGEKKTSYRIEAASSR